eukprot:gene19451-biopygen22043
MRQPARGDMSGDTSIDRGGVSVRSMKKNKHVNSHRACRPQAIEHWANCPVERFALWETRQWLHAGHVPRTQGTDACAGCTQRRFLHAPSWRLGHCYSPRRRRWPFCAQPTQGAAYQSFDSTAAAATTFPAARRCAVLLRRCSRRRPPTACAPSAAAPPPPRQTMQLAPLSSFLTDLASGKPLPVSIGSSQIQIQGVWEKDNQLSNLLG